MSQGLGYLSWASKKGDKGYFYGQSLNVHWGGAHMVRMIMAAVAGEVRRSVL
jgi:hypothetical protein